MSTAYYQYEIPGVRHKTMEEALSAKRLIGVRTFEAKKKCFTWAMQPGQFMYNAHFFGKFLGVVDEYGHMQLMASWLQELQNIDVMRYDRDDLPEGSNSRPPGLPDGVIYADLTPHEGTYPPGKE